MATLFGRCSFNVVVATFYNIRLDELDEKQIKNKWSLGVVFWKKY